MDIAVSIFTKHSPK